MLKLNYLLRALLYPAGAPRNSTVFQHILRKPRVFDIISCLLQLRDHRRLLKIHDASPKDEFYSKVKGYNAGITQQKVISTTRRAETLYQILSFPPRDLSKEKLLIVGPRNVQELFIAWLYGFTWKNILAIDLYSTNPKILVVNMERLTFRNESFDAVVMANTLAYARDTLQCLSEVSRVLKCGGRFVFGATYFPESVDWPGNRICGNEILAMLRKLSFNLVFYYAIDKINSLGGKQTVHIFSVEKEDPSHPGFDGITW